MSASALPIHRDRDYHPVVYWLGLLTAILTSTLISIGAVVTTIDAGMAFLDWPTSDGMGMFEYPWLKSTGDYFWEHGHRLNGSIVGLVAIVLVVVVHLVESRPLAKWLAYGVLAAVISQGLLGGARVIQDKKVLAMIHGICAPWVFSVMCVQILVNTRGWLAAVRVSASGTTASFLGWAWFWGWATLVTLQLQYVLGGLLRHLGNSFAWSAHPWFAIVPGLCALMLGYYCIVSGSRWLGRWGWFVIGCIVVQIALGIGTWALRYGYPQFGIIAIQQSSPQMLLRCVHMVMGVVTLMAAVVALVRIARIAPIAAAGVAPVDRSDGAENQVVVAMDGPQVVGGVS